MQTIKEQFKNLLSQEQYNFWIEPTLEIVDEYGKSTLVVKMEACQSVVAMMLKRYGVEGQVIFEGGQKEYQYPTKKPKQQLDEKFWAEKIAKLDEKFGRKKSEEKEETRD